MIINKSKPSKSISRITNLRNAISFLIVSLMKWVLISHLAFLIIYIVFEMAVNFKTPLIDLYKWSWLLNFILISLFLMINKCLEVFGFKLVLLKTRQ